MLLPWPIAALCRALGARFKPVVTPLNTPFIPRLDHLEDRRLMATNLFAVDPHPEKRLGFRSTITIPSI